MTYNSGFIRKENGCARQERTTVLRAGDTEHAIQRTGWRVAEPVVAMLRTLWHRSPNGQSASALAAQVPKGRCLELFEYEPLRLFSATPLPPPVVDASAITEATTAPPDPTVATASTADANDASLATTTPALSSEDSTSTNHHHEVVFVDDSVPDWQSIIQSLEANHQPDTQLDIFILDHQRDGVEQISATLAAEQDVDSVRVISNGAGGAVQLGSVWLADANLEQFRDRIADWKRPLAPDATFEFYASDLAANESGKRLLQELAQLTGAEVAASTNPSGNSQLGGDWEWEYQPGEIDGQLVFGAPEVVPDPEFVGAAEVVLNVQEQSHEIVFVDAAVSNWQTLLDDLQTQGDGMAIEAVVLDSNRNGLEQITAMLAERSDISAVHIISHGSPGEIKLGNTWLTEDVLADYATQLRTWGQALTADADILIYGCEVARNEAGRQMLSNLSTLTGADVNASTDNTGNALFGGDWQLEFATGSIEAHVIVSDAAQQQWMNLMNVAVDAASSGTADSLSSLTVTHTTSGTNRLMLVSIALDPHGASANSVTYDGVNLSLVGTEELAGTHSRVEIWSLVAPSTGTHDVVVSLSGTAYHGVIVGVMTFTGVDQSTPVVNFTSATGSSTPASATVASQAGDQVFAVVHSHNSGTSTPAGGQTEYWNQTVDQSNGSGTVQAGAASVGNSWTVSNGDWTVAGVSVQSVSNTAPTLDTTKSPVLSAINEDAGAPSGAVGTLVSSLVDFASPSGQVDNVTDPDGGAQLGIALTDADTTNGSWWYSTDDGTNWNALGSVSSASARLLAADANTRIYFQPNADYNGTVSTAITFRAWDQTSGTNGGMADTTTNGGTTAFSTATDTCSITVNAVNDAPVNSVPGAQTTPEDTPLVFSTANGNLISISDVDAGTSLIQVALSATNGTLTLSGTTGLSFVSGANGTSALQVQGTIANINTALDGMTFTPTAGFSGGAGIGMVANDLGNTGAGGSQSAISGIGINVTGVNDPPTATISAASYSVNEQTALVLQGTGMSIADVDAGSSNVQVTLSVASGTLSAAVGTTGVSISGNGTSSVILTGSVTQIDDLLAGNLGGTLTYLNSSDNPPGTVILTVDVDDLGNTGVGGPLTDSATAPINIFASNDPPAATIAAASYNATEQTPLALQGTGLSIADPDAGAATVQATVSVVSGTLTASAGTTGVAISGNGTNSIVFSGAITQVNNLLAGNLGGTLTYLENSDAPPAADTLTLNVNDLGNSGAGTSLTDSATAPINIAVVNDGPVATIAAAGYSATQYAPLVLSGTGLSISDVDAGTGNLQATVLVIDGTLTAAAGATGVVIAGNGTNSVALSGTLTQINDLLAGNFGGSLVYTNSLPFPPATDTLTLQVDDLGQSGAGGPLMANASVPISVANAGGIAISAPGVQVGTGTIVFSAANGNAIVISDLSGNPLQVTLTAVDGRLTLDNTAGLTFLAGSGANDQTMTFQGSLTAINAALDGLQFASNGQASGRLLIDAVEPNTSGGPMRSASAAVDLQIFLGSGTGPTTGTDPGSSTNNDDSQSSQRSSSASVGLPTAAPARPMSAEATEAFPSLALGSGETAPAAAGRTRAGTGNNASTESAQSAETIAAQVARAVAGQLKAGPGGFATRALNNTLAGLFAEFDSLPDEAARRQYIDHLVAGAATGLIVGTSATYILWLLRAGILASQAANFLQPWQSFDPLAVLEFADKKEPRRRRARDYGEEGVADLLYGHVVPRRRTSNILTQFLPFKKPEGERRLK